MVQAAQNQHYVPKLILRSFLSDEVREYVTVFDKNTGKDFPTNIDNIMGERRFHDFHGSDDEMKSFEPMAQRFEDGLKPAYRQVLRARQLAHTPQEQASLAMLVAFQLLRTRRSRDRFVEMERAISKKLQGLGFKLEDIAGYEPLTENTLKREHATFIYESLQNLTNIIGGKQMLLYSAAPGRDFYISDNPVVLHNTTDTGPYGNLGVGVKGIEIYMPLSSDLMLACLCPSLMNEMAERVETTKRNAQAALLPLVVAGAMSAAQMKAQLDELEQSASSLREWQNQYADGIAVVCNDDNMDFYNSLQMSQSSRWIVSKPADFRFAKRFMKDHPGHKPMRFVAA